EHVPRIRSSAKVGETPSVVSLNSIDILMARFALFSLRPTRLDLIERLSSPLHFLHDSGHGCSPHTRLWRFVPGFQAFPTCFLKLSDADKCSTTDGFLG